MQKARVILADDRAERRRELTELFDHPQIEYVECVSEADVLRCLEGVPCDIVIIGSVKSACCGAVALLEAIRLRQPACSAIFLDEHAHERAGNTALLTGIAIAISAPASTNGEPGLPSPATRSPAIRAARTLIGSGRSAMALRASIRKVAHADSNVLIAGDTGTGKELVAEAIHHGSARRHKPFVRLNCAAIPEALLESELFGHEKGSFTGANQLREGKLEQANGGTVLLDEIGEMSMTAQSKILRALEEKEVHRVGGGRRGVEVDFRIIAATNRDLRRAVEVGNFRADLYFRLNVWRIDVPSLRDRKEDIPELCDHFIRVFNQQFGLPISGLTKDAADLLVRYNWPGNVRELRNAIEYAFINHSSNMLQATDLPATILTDTDSSLFQQGTERDRLLATLVSCKWNKSKAAQQLNWSRMTLYRKMIKHQLADELASRAAC
jgi:DNA-binding NtrC family response regulator